MRWIVGRDSPASLANSRWSIPSIARAARICAEVITYAADGSCIHIAYEASCFDAQAFSLGSPRAIGCRTASTVG